MDFQRGGAPKWAPETKSFERKNKIKSARTGGWVPVRQKNKKKGHPFSVDHVLPEQLSDLLALRLFLCDERRSLVPGRAFSRVAKRPASRSCPPNCRGPAKIWSLQPPFLFICSIFAAQFLALPPLECARFFAFRLLRCEPRPLVFPWHRVTRASPS